MVKRIDKKLLPALHFHKKREFWIRKMSTHPLYYILLYIDIVVLHQNSLFLASKKNQSHLIHLYNMVRVGQHSLRSNPYHPTR